jgi:hypothetical protein
MTARRALINPALGEFDIAKMLDVVEDNAFV